MKGWNVTTTAPFSRHDCRHRDGRKASQVQAIAQVRSAKRMVELLKDAGMGGWSVYAMRQFGSPHLNSEMEEALSMYPPETMLIHPLDPGDTIDGKVGWLRA